MNITKKVELGSKINLTGPIAGNYQICQKFIADSDFIHSITVPLATYKRSNPGSLVFEIQDFRGVTISSDEVESILITDNSPYEFVVDVAVSIGTEYRIKIDAINGATIQKSVTAFFSDQNIYDAGRLTIGNGFVRDAELSCIINYSEMIDSKVNYMDGLVTVVIPHLNCHHLLSKCLYSLSRQTYRAMEVFVVDDGSDDPMVTKTVVDAWKIAIPGLHFLSHQKNMGAPVARNKGASIGIGEYLLFVDADVQMYPRSIEYMVSRLVENPDIDFTYGSFMWGKLKVEPLHFDLDNLKRANYITTMSMMRHGVFPRWDESLKRQQDWDLWLTIALNGGVGMYCEKILFETPVRQGSISTDENISIKNSRCVVLKKHGIADHPALQSLVE